MARRTLGPASLQVVQAVAGMLSDHHPEAAIVACSGGADSMALAAATRHVCGAGVRAVVVDHGLQAGSAQLAAAVVERLAAIGVQGTVAAVTVTERGDGPESAARDARLAALAAARQGRPVLLGHTLDDQAETVLLGLARGSGSRSLAGMAAVSGCFRRPLLGVRRSVTRAACSEWGLTIWEDPHNADPRFRRSRIRLELMPEFERVLGPGVAEALARTAELARDDADALDAAALSVADPAAATLDAAALSAAPRALRSRAIRAWLLLHGAQQPGFGQVRAVDALVSDWHGQAGVDLAGVTVRRRNGQLRVEDSAPGARL